MHTGKIEACLALQLYQLARAVNVVRPDALRLHIDRARYAKSSRLEWHAGNVQVGFWNHRRSPLNICSRCVLCLLTQNTMLALFPEFC